MAADFNRLQGFIQGGRTAHFHYVVDAEPLRQLERFVAPLRRGFVVDGFIGAHRSYGGELFIGGGGGNHSGAHRFSDLQRRDRDAAGSLHQHRFTRFKLTICDQRAPGRQGGSGDGGRLDMAPALRRMGEGAFRTNNIFARHAIDAVAGRMGKVACRGQRFACWPDGEKGRDDGIASLERFNAFSYFFHNACTV